MKLEGTPLRDVASAAELVLLTVLLTMTRLHVLLELPKVVRALRLLHGREQSSKAAREGSARRGGAHDSAITLLVIEIEHQLTQLGLAHLP